MHELGLGNNAGRIEEDFGEWSGGLMNSLTEEEAFKEGRVPQTKDITIYWGSSSGTSHGFADQLASSNPGIKFVVEDLNEFNEQEFMEMEYVVFIVATYGSGGPTPNAQRFHTWLKEQMQKGGKLNKLKFAVFGCGNSGFAATYNHMSIFTSDALNQLGAKMYILYSILRLCKSGLGDSNKNVAHDFQLWSAGLVEVIRAEFHVEGKITSSKMIVYESEFIVDVGKSLKVPELKDQREYVLTTDQYLSASKYYYHIYIYIY